MFSECKAKNRYSYQRRKCYFNLWKKYKNVVSSITKEFLVRGWSRTRLLRFSLWHKLGTSVNAEANARLTVLVKYPARESEGRRIAGEHQCRARRPRLIEKIVGLFALSAPRIQDSFHSVKSWRRTAYTWGVCNTVRYTERSPFRGTQNRSIRALHRTSAKDIRGKYLRPNVQFDKIFADSGWKDS